MNAAVSPSVSSNTHDPESIRRWIAELTDFTPQQIEAILSQMEETSPLSSQGVFEESVR